MQPGVSVNENPPARSERERRGRGENKRWKWSSLRTQRKSGLTGHAC